jgi:hypothetical protein
VADLVGAKKKEKFFDRINNLPSFHKKSKYLIIEAEGYIICVTRGESDITVYYHGNDQECYEALEVMKRSGKYPWLSNEDTTQFQMFSVCTR